MKEKVDDTARVVTVRIPPRLGVFAGGEREWKVTAKSVGEALRAVCREHVELERRIFEPDGSRFRSYVRVFVDDEQSDMDTALRHSATVLVLPAIGGGGVAGQRCGG